MLLNNKRVKKEIKKEIKRYLEINEKENKTTQKSMRHRVRSPTREIHSITSRRKKISKKYNFTVKDTTQRTNKTQNE